MGIRYFLGGGIGSGKSTAALEFVSLGAVVVSGDDAGRAVLRPGTPETRVVAARWPAVVSADGVVDRAALGRIVFAASDELRTLEDITREGIRRHVLEAVDLHPDDVVLVEVPVLRDPVDQGWEWIVVDAPDEVRVDRVVARGHGMSAGEVREVMSRQPSRGEWLAAAAWVIDNRHGPAELAEQCRRVWEEIAP